MRTLLTMTAVTIAFGCGAAPARAQYPYGYYRGGFAVNPYVVPPAYSAFAAYRSPFGYRSYFNAAAYPGPWGYNTFYNYGTFVRPIVTAPFHSVVFNPFTWSYQFPPGYLNTPFFFYGYSGFPY